MKNSDKMKNTGPKGLEAHAMVVAAIDFMEEVGNSAFSMRKLAAKIACDPMSLQYHFKSKKGLERAMAEELTRRISTIDNSMPWDERLRHLAYQYRQIALAYPNSFKLMQQFWSTGLADYIRAEYVCQALTDAGFNDNQVTSFCLGYYACIIGLAASEAGGLLRPADDADLNDIENLPQQGFTLTKKLAPAFQAVEPGQVFAFTVELFLQGIKKAL
ncbi:TetR/AcrR family transcriptional regulator [Gilliamella sp. wkB292]|uniref:TetR/AcrR family transcriptional regulator n=1 Tax=Gilliamella sp. wkB292 TaxID=3120262 RepID=UPI000A73753D|nr:TetR/AcrR family transcriptional regulator C-terminal domain-containing protein [Gilliamella apicola]